MIPLNVLAAIGLLLLASGILIWGFWGKIKVCVFRQPEARINAIEAQYYIVEQGKFIIELEITIICLDPPKQIAWLQLLIAGKPHDLTESRPSFKDEITTGKVSYKACYKMPYRDFLRGRARHSGGDDIAGQVVAKIGGKDVYSQEFKIWGKVRNG